MAAVHRQRVLGQVVGADREEVHFRREAVGHDRGGRHLDHDADAGAGGTPSASRCLSTRSRAARHSSIVAIIGNIMCIVPARAARRMARTLGAQHLGPVEAHPDAALAEEGVVLGGQRQVGQRLVAADVEGADHERRLGCRPRDDVLVDLGLLVLGRRRTAPTEDEQTAAYEDIIRRSAPERLVVVRTLDVGGDKPLCYLPVPAEANPFLGERGIRLLLNRPELFASHVRAILRASRAGKVAMMFPMISTMGEWRAARELVELQRLALGVPPAPRRHHDRDRVGRAPGRPLRAGSGLLLDRHQRSDPIHAGDGPHPSGPRAPGRTHCIRRCCA